MPPRLCPLRAPGSTIDPVGNPIPGTTVEQRALVLLPYILDYCGPMNVGALLAILEHESKMGKNVNGAGTAKLGAALGPWQIMTAYVSSYSVTTTSAFEPGASTKGVCGVLVKSHDIIMERVPEAANDLPLYAYLLYVAHNAGPGGMKTIINRTLAQVAHPITVDSVRPYAAAYVGSTAREPGYYAVAYGSSSLNERGAAAWQQWAAPAVRITNAPSPWATPLLVTTGLLVLTALATAAYLEQSGSRSRWVHWAPSRA